MRKRLLHVACFVLVLGTISAGTAMAADPNLVGWWPLNEGSGDTVADLSGGGMNGTIINPAGGLGLDGSVWIEDAERGTVLNFNGVNGTGACVKTGMTIPAMDLTTDFTWMFWCKQDASQGVTAATGGNDVILGNRYGGTSAPLQFVKFTPTNFEYYNGDNTNFIAYPQPMPSTVWVHNATVKDGDKLTYYRDGVMVRSITLTKTVDANPFYMGADAYNGVQEAWCGCLSDVRLYNKAATQLDVLAAMLGVERIDMAVGYATRAPVIDGEVDAIWNNASTQSFVPLEDPADASGTWKVLYDAENLYVLLDITDDSLKNDSASSWQDDSVEVYFDGGNTKLTTPLSGDDHQFTFGWTADDIQGTNITGATDGIEQAQVTTATGWRIEIKMPWLSIQGAAPQARDLIGIDCYYNDDDDGGDSREGKMLSFSAVEGWNDASQWGTAILGDVPVPVEPGTDGLVAFYAFENDVNDSSGNGLNGTIVGNLTFGEGPAGYGSAMIFANEAYVDCGNDPKLDITGEISLALWIRPDAEDPEGKGTETAPMAKATSTANPSWSWQVRYGWYSPKPYMAFTFNTSPRAWVYVGQKLTQGEWAHIACSADGTTLRCYLDGVQTDSTAMGAITGSPTNLLIGSDGWGSDWIGGIDEVAIYNRALSAEEILYLTGFGQ
ncbi:MAG: LamG-like jellyroll fold domain-containing protein [Solirubrobacterales bacterium]